MGCELGFKNHQLKASDVFVNYPASGKGVFGSPGYLGLQSIKPWFTVNLASQVTKYNQIRLLLGYGSPTKRGLSVAANAGYDLVQDALRSGDVQPPTTGTAVGLPSNTGAWPWVRCAMKINTASTSRWPGWAPRAI